MSNYYNLYQNKGYHADEDEDSSLNEYLDHQQMGTYNYGNLDSRSTESVNFLPPEPIYNQGGGTSSYQGYQGYYNDDEVDANTRPTEIFNTSGGLNPPPHIGVVGPDGSYENFYKDDPNESSYELKNLVDYSYAGASSNEGLEPAFGNTDYDEEENGYDQNIQYNQIQGDSYDLRTIMVPTDSSSEDIDSPFADSSEKAANLLPEEAEPIRSKAKMGIAPGVNGNLVLDCPVATELLRKFPNYKYDQPDGGLPREFAYMRYTAVTCGPSNFYREGYILRPIHYPTPRQTEIMIVVTMYNEDDILLGRTLKGIFKNIKHLESRSRSSTWGKDSWKKIVVCIVSDGRSKINERAQALLAGLGVYQEGLAKSRVDDQKVQAHIYEYTTRVGISSLGNTVKLTTDKIVPVQLLFCLKEKNAKKINSHRWCFQALGQVLNPNIVVLLDAGTQPAGKSIYHLWKEFHRDPKVAGACGEIKASLKKRQLFTNPLVYGQNFEYKISNILDKPTESVFGFISVLPGAFSAYRFVALQNDINGKGPLEKYFKGEFLHGSGELDPQDDEYELKKTQMKREAGIFTSNMYLAEDRILCFELVAKKGCAWLLRYCRPASAETDVPERMAEFVLQRRRWLNGSFFAAIYALVHFPKVWTSSHSIGRKIFLHLLFFYQTINLIVSWFSIGSYFLVFRILSTSLADESLNFAPGNVLSVVFLWLYLASIVTTFVLSFGNKPQGTEKFYVVIVIFFAILMGYMIFASIFMAVKAVEAIYNAHTKITVSLFFGNEEFRDLVVANASTYALYFISSLIYLEPWHMLTSFIQYILLSPAYINVLNIYAFCNIHDVSWGTKGDTGAVDLGTAKVRDDGTFDVDIPIHKEEINKSYLNQLEKIRDPYVPPKGKGEESSEDYYAFIRSMTVLIWMFSNFAIIAVVLETGGVDQFSENSDTLKTTRSKIFLTVILWTVAFMALFRFIGCIAYLIGRFIRKFK